MTSVTHIFLKERVEPEPSEQGRPARNVQPHRYVSPLGIELRDELRQADGTRAFDDPGALLRRWPEGRA